jgi:hypothetical protein
MDTHRLRMITLGIDDDRTPCDSCSPPRRVILNGTRGFAARTPATFEVCSSKKMGVRLDGESLAIEPPLSLSWSSREGKPGLSA